MAKGWNTVYTNKDNTVITRAERVAADHRSSNVIRKIKHSPTLDQLMSMNDAAYEEAKGEEAKLMDAFNDNRLKSQNAIKRAMEIKKKAEDAKKRESA